VHTHELVLTVVPHSLDRVIPVTKSRQGIHAHPGIYYESTDFQILFFKLALSRSSFCSMKVAAILVKQL